MTTRTARSAMPDLALHAERLGAGAGVGHHQRREHRDHDGGHGGVVAGLGELEGDGGEHDALLHAVQRRVEERAEARALARHARVAAVERVADGADDERQPAQEVVVVRRSAPPRPGTATRPVREMALGVSRDSMRRLRTSVWYSRAVVGRGAFGGGEGMRRGADASGRRAGEVAAASMPRRPAACGRSRRRRGAETAATARRRTASNHQWLAVATTTNVTSSGYAYQSACAASCAGPSRHRHAQHQRERDVHRRHGGERVVERVGGGARATSAR